VEKKGPRATRIHRHERSAKQSKKHDGVAVRLHRWVVGQQAQGLGERLGNQHPIKGIPVQRGQVLDGRGMICRNGEQLIARGLEVSKRVGA
jgi:hypothetical protein